MKNNTIDRWEEPVRETEISTIAAAKMQAAVDYIKIKINLFSHNWKFASSPLLSLKLVRHHPSFRIRVIQYTVHLAAFTPIEKNCISPIKLPNHLVTDS